MYAGLKIIIGLLVININIAFGQNKDRYFELVNEAQKLYKLKKYKESSNKYEKAFNQFDGKAYPNDRYNAACSYALAKNIEKSFYHLFRLANSKTKYKNYEHISSDKDLSILHKYKRWTKLLTIVKSNKEEFEKDWDKSLIAVLDSMVKEDQKWRGIIRQIQNNEIDSISIEEAAQKMRIADSTNHIFLLKIFKKYGFLGYDKVGKRGSHNFWLMIQHQDKYPEFQNSVLKSMEIEARKGNASYVNYAYLLDRVKVNNGQLQIYGTQMKINKEGYSYEPKPVIEPAKLNERRKNIGLSPIEEYIKTMNNRYFGTIKR